METSAGRAMKSILFVEDDEMSRDVISTRLTRSGYAVTAAENGSVALDLLKTRRFDLIVLDMSMPVLSGWELARRLKADGDSKSTPILALSAHAMNSERKKAIDAGCSDFDSKPVNLPRLLEKIEALLNDVHSSPSRPPSELS